MYIDINDILKELYGTEMTEGNLRRNGGAGIWDLYFDLAENHARHYRAFQKSVCSEDDRNLYFINELFLIPVCRQEKKREVMSREEGQEILSKVSQPLTANQYRETVGFLSEHRLSDDDIQILLDKQLQDRKKECAGNSLLAGRSVCRGRLARLFSHWSEFICDHTALAMNVFNDITNAKAEMNRLFLKSMKSGFKEEVQIPGSILWGSLTRNGRTINSEGQESLNNEIWDKMQNEFSDSYLRDHFVREDIEGFWKEMAGYEPDDLLNNTIFARQLPFTAMNRESEHLLQLEDLFSHTALLKECFEKHEEMVVSAFLYDKPRISKVLLKRMADNQCQPIAMSRQEFFLIFLNRYPSFDDGRKMMSADTLANIRKYAIADSNLISLPELLKLLAIAERERLSEEVLISWTEQYFAAELRKLS